MLKCYIYMMKPWLNRYHQNMAMGVAYQSSSYDSTKRILTMSRSDATIYERVRRQTIGNNQGGLKYDIMRNGLSLSLYPSVIECIYLIPLLSNKRGHYHTVACHGA
eukprot:138095_1